MSAFYNDNDRFAAAWLRELIAAGYLPAGDVDERSIADIDPAGLAGRDECHFFAGIGGWPYALRLAGWRGPVWTGSCPCQPLSIAGQRKGHADRRHLWPAFYRLIAECRPPVVFGEQVASKLGREWLAGIRVDLEQLGYAVGAADLPAAGVGAPHIRQRLFWVADASGDECRARRNDGTDGRRAPQFAGLCDAGGLGDADTTRSQGRGERPDKYPDQRSPWTAGEFIRCLDGKARRVEPGVFPLAHGASARVGRLRGYGNAIVAPLAAKFISAFMECSQ